MNKRKERGKGKNTKESMSCFPFGDFKAIEEMMANCCNEMKVPECCSPKGTKAEEQGEVKK